jgi:hypothetical protein
MSNNFEQLQKDLCDCWEEIVSVRKSHATSINDKRYEEIHKQYRDILSKISDLIQEGMSYINSVVTCSSTASRKRRAELRLRQLKEKQETEHRSEEVCHELELQSARHYLLLVS